MATAGLATSRYMLCLLKTSMAPCLTAAGSSCGSCICVVTAVAWFGQLLWLQRRTTAYLMLHGLEPAASGRPAVAASGSRAVPCRACWKPCRAVTAGDGGTPCGGRRVWWLLLPLLLHTVSGLMLGDCCCCCTPRPAPYFAAAGGSRQHGTAAGHGGSSSCGSWARSWALR